MINLMKPDWPAPENIHAYTTTRMGGYSESPYDTLNLAHHVGDNLDNVTLNRDLLIETLVLPSTPVWLNQVHSTKIICIDDFPSSLECDGSFAKTVNKVCTVLTADCLPILITNKKGTIVSALHAGWRGLALGIIEQGIEILQNYTQDFLVWLGPAIGPQAFQVGPEVREQFLQKDSDNEKAFIPSENDRWLANIYELAKNSLRNVGVNNIYGGNYCTYDDSKRFYSFRRDGNTGRMASLIWMTPNIVK